MSQNIGHKNSVKSISIHQNFSSPMFLLCGKNTYNHNVCWSSFHYMIVFYLRINTVKYSDRESISLICRDKSYINCLYTYWLTLRLYCIYYLKHCCECCMENTARGGVLRDKYSTRWSQVLYLSQDMPPMLYFCTHEFRWCFKWYIVFWVTIEL